MKKLDVEHEGICLKASHHNWGLKHRDSWSRTEFILYNDGYLQMTAVWGPEIDERYVESEEEISSNELLFIKENIEKYIQEAEEIRAFDGTAWRVQCGDIIFDLGYVYGTDLERVTSILAKYDKHACGVSAFIAGPVKRSR